MSLIFMNIKTSDMYYAAFESIMQITDIYYA